MKKYKTFDNDNDIRKYLRDIYIDNVEEVIEEEDIWDPLWDTFLGDKPQTNEGEDIDVENFSVIRVGKNKVIMCAGGDWQDPVKFEIILNNNIITVNKISDDESFEDGIDFCSFIDKIFTNNKKDDAYIKYKQYCDDDLDDDIGVFNSFNTVEDDLDDDIGIENEYSPHYYIPMGDEKFLTHVILKHELADYNIDSNILDDDEALVFLVSDNKLYTDTNNTIINNSPKKLIKVKNGIYKFKLKDHDAIIPYLYDIS